MAGAPGTYAGATGTYAGATYTAAQTYAPTASPPALYRSASPTTMAFSGESYPYLPDGSRYVNPDEYIKEPRAVIAPTSSPAETAPVDTGAAQPQPEPGPGAKRFFKAAHNLTA